MSVSRRKFIKAGVIATVFSAGLPIKSALAQTGAAAQSPSVSGGLEQLGYYTRSAFDPYINTQFRVYLSPSSTRSLKLIKVGDYLASLGQRANAAVASGDECFSLLFTLPPGKPFTQDTYLIEHDALGTFYMFVVPVSAHNKIGSDLYEAVFYRRQQYAAVGEPTGVTETKSPVTGIEAQPVRNPQPASAAAPAIILPGSQEAREERDIYRFRPREIDSTTIAGQTNGTRAGKKGIYPLTMTQFPAINGLRLGMTPEQVLALFPGSQKDEEVRTKLSRPPSRFGVSTFKIKPGRYSSASKFDGISQIIFTLLDNRVSTLYLGYDGPVWEHVDEFVTKFSEGKNLPALADYWEPYVGMDDRLKTLKCQDFELSLFAGGKNLDMNYVQTRDLLALQKYKERRMKAKHG